MELIAQKLIKPVRRDFLIVERIVCVFKISFEYTLYWCGRRVVSFLNVIHAKEPKSNFKLSLLNESQK